MTIDRKQKIRRKQIVLAIIFDPMSLKEAVDYGKNDVRQQWEILDLKKSKFEEARNILFSAEF